MAVQDFVLVRGVDTGVWGRGLGGVFGAFSPACCAMPLPAVRCHCLLCGAIAASRVACRRVDVHRYSSDFGADSTAILRWIRPFLMSDVQSVLDGVMRKGSVKVDHVPYDWSVNSK